MALLMHYFHCDEIFSLFFMLFTLFETTLIFIQIKIFYEKDYMLKNKVEVFPVVRKIKRSQLHILLKGIVDSSEIQILLII